MFMVIYMTIVNRETKLLQGSSVVVIISVVVVGNVVVEIVVDVEVVVFMDSVRLCCELMLEFG